MMQESNEWKTVTREELPNGGFKLFTRYKHSKNIPLIDIYDAQGRIVQHYTGTDKCARCDYIYDDEGLKRKIFSDGRIYERCDDGKLYLIINALRETIQDNQGTK